VLKASPASAAAAIRGRRRPDVAALRASKAEPRDSAITTVSMVLLRETSTLAGITASAAAAASAAKSSWVRRREAQSRASAAVPARACGSMRAKPP
jgi:hypothetical protein